MFRQQICTWDHQTVICRLQPWWKFTTLYSVQLVVFVWEKCRHMFKLICRLFQPSTDTSQRKWCQQISFLWQSILFPFAQLIDPGQVTPSGPCSQNMVSSIFFLQDWSVSFCSRLFPVWSLANHSHHQRRKTQLPTFHNSPLCSSWGYICNDRFTSSLQDFCFCHMLLLGSASVTIVSYDIPTWLHAGSAH